MIYIRHLILIIITLITTVDLSAVAPVRQVGTAKPEAGLDNRVIALWNSHGLYYNSERGEWLRQRAPLNTTVEDVYTSTYVLDLLAPMLENAGAYVMLPRERDTSTLEVIIDNSDTGFKTRGRWAKTERGYGRPERVIVDGDNPMTAADALSTTDPDAVACWSGIVPMRGNYTLYVTYPAAKQSGKVRYTVHSLKGDETFEVDQSMGAGTWMRLGEFDFGATDEPHPLVTMQGRTGVALADAIRIGGGMGSVARGDGEDVKVSGFPRWTEGARYWLQYTGYPPEVYTPDESETDYTDDIRCRPLWVNYLAGGSARNPRQPGLNIPVDIALALHTDAGITPDTTIVGTLGIYCTDGNRRLGDGRRRTLNRRLTETVVDRVVGDIRQLYQPGWVKRKTRDRRYAEARYADVPSALIELLSHQNYADMTLGLDPKFRFDVARAIYKGILQYFYDDIKGDPVVQPLPVMSIAADKATTGRYTLSWLPQTDPLEPSAMPTGYIVQQRDGREGAFRDVATTTHTSLNVDLQPGQLMSFRVIAVNAGGRSMPSEVVAIGRVDSPYSDVLVVNGFTRVSAPERFDDGVQAGFLDKIDYGVPMGRNVGYIGCQYDYDRASLWESDDQHPGHGASHTEYFGKIMAGNTMDYAATHGQAIMKSGRGFVSASRDGYLRLDSLRQYDNFKIIDLIMGKQREVTRGNVDPTGHFKAFDEPMQSALERRLSTDGRLLVSGSRIACDLLANELSNDSTMASDRHFANDILGIDLADAFVASSGKVEIAPWWANDNRRGTIEFNTVPSADIYIVESPDALSSTRPGATVLGRYHSDRQVAAVAVPPSRSHGPVVAYGFPIETLGDIDDISATISAAMLYLSPERLVIAPQPHLPLPAIDPIDVDEPEDLPVPTLLPSKISR